MPRRTLVRVTVHVTKGEPQQNGDYRWVADVVHSETRSRDLDVTDNPDPVSLVQDTAVLLYEEAK